ncbi:MAG: hypothetical protein LBB72_09265 [Spirochaetaceae bacterium]|nr:hypothetical protein [Spirochaetaceae bacterium]
MTNLRDSCRGTCKIHDCNTDNTTGGGDSGSWEGGISERGGKIPKELLS